MGCGGSKTAETNEKPKDNKTNTNTNTNTDVKKDEKKDEKKVEKKDEKVVTDKKQDIKMNGTNDVEIVKNLEKSEVKNNVKKEEAHKEHKEETHKVEEKKESVKEVKKINIMDDNNWTTNTSVVFGVFPPLVNKYRILAQPMSKHGFVCISTKDLLKEAIESKEEGFERLAEAMKKKEFASSDLVVELILRKMYPEIQKGHTKFFISGFPRCEDNSRSWKKLANSKKVSVKALIFLTYTREEHLLEVRDEEDYSKIPQKPENLISELFDHYLKHTRDVFDDFGLNKLIKISAKVEDETIVEKVLNNDLIESI